AARDPTMATAGASSARMTPRTQRSGGGSKIAASAGGYRGSLHGTASSPAASARASAAAARAAKDDRLSVRAARRLSRIASGESPARSESPMNRRSLNGSSESIVHAEEANAATIALAALARRARRQRSATRTAKGRTAARRTRGGPTSQHLL